MSCARGIDDEGDGGEKKERCLALPSAVVDHWWCGDPAYRSAEVWCMGDGEDDVDSGDVD